MKVAGELKNIDTESYSAIVSASDPRNLVDAAVNSLTFASLAKPGYPRLRTHFLVETVKHLHLNSQFY